MPRLHLVRHARPLVDPAAAPHTWDLDPAGLADLAALAVSGRLPTRAAWYSSPEPKAIGTARRLTDRPVTVVDALAEHHRGVHWFADPADFRAAVRRAVEAPDEPAVDEWEPLSATRDRLVPAVHRILEAPPGQEVVLVGHGTAWTLLVSELTGRPADLEAWAALRMPDVWTLTRSGSGTGRWECDTGTSHD
jgi:broad specificity phosphatase PhoE